MCVVTGKLVLSVGQSPADYTSVLSMKKQCDQASQVEVVGEEDDNGEQEERTMLWVRLS